MPGNGTRNTEYVQIFYACLCLCTLFFFFFFFFTSSQQHRNKRTSVLLCAHTQLHIEMQLNRMYSKRICCECVCVFAYLYLNSWLALGDYMSFCTIPAPLHRFKSKSSIENALTHICARSCLSLVLFRSLVVHCDEHSFPVLPVCVW